MLNGLDLFSGIGGISLALRPWVRTVAYCENDRYAQAVLLSKMARRELQPSPIWDDVRTLRGDFLPGIDIISGGFPCQDISVAGTGEGLDGERSGLFFEIVRLAKEIRPKFIFLENVPAIRTRGASRVIQELSAAGYDCRWDVVSAAEVGAPHLRKRWFLLAHAQSNGRQQRRTEPIPKGKAGPSVHYFSDSECGRLEESGNAQTGSANSITDESWWSVEPYVGRVVNGLPHRVDRLRGLGNAVVPAQAREAFVRLMGLK